MATQPVINLEQLLSPIPGDNPCGENLIYAGLYDQLREARRADDSRLSQGEWERDSKAADWRLVENLATEALAAKTKDLQVCAWLIEALVKNHGFVGLRDGLQLMGGLMERYWEGVFPEIDGGDLEGRANTVSFMEGRTALGLREVPLTGNPAGANYSYLQFEEARKIEIPDDAENLSGDELDRIAQLRETAALEGKTTSEQWRMAKNASNRAFYEGIHAVLNQCLDEFKNLDRTIDEKFGAQAPAMSALKKSLEEIGSLAERLLKEKRVLEPDEAGQTEATAGLAGEITQDGYGPPIGGPIRTRREALKRLAEVSDYFRQTEPHSPVSYLVQRAINWGNMPLDTWLEDVIKDAAVLSQLRETLGLKQANKPLSDDLDAGSS
jgi:type VI secretion system protein ImpA